VHQMVRHTMIDSIKNIGYDNSHWREAFHNAEDFFSASNCSILQILSCILSLHLMSLTRKHHLLKSIADSHLIAMTMNCLLLTTLSVLCIQGHGAA
jgi:hypothetical protein